MRGTENLTVKVCWWRPQLISGNPQISVHSSSAAELYIWHDVNFKWRGCTPNSKAIGANKSLTVGGAAVPSPASVEVRRTVCRPSAALLLFIGLHLFRSRSIHLPTRSGHRLASAPATQILPRTNGRRCAPPPPPPDRGHASRTPGWVARLAPDGVGNPTALFPPPAFSNIE